MRSQDGFVLAATLWILAAITLSAGFFALWTHHVLELTRQHQADLHGEIAMSSTRSAVLYLLATQRMSFAGLTIPGEASADPKAKPVNLLENFGRPLGGEIGLDGRAYSGLETACFSIQDEAGLLSLNHFYPSHLEKLLGLSGVPSDRRGPLRDKLLDYTDVDDLHRLNGAEADDYEREGLPPPPNRELLTSWEVRNVLGWKAQKELWEGYALPRLTTVASGGMPNLNTAPKQIVKTLTDMDDESAAILIDARREKPFYSVRDISRALGRKLPLDPMGTGFFPATSLRVTLWHTGGRRMREVHVRLTPQADKAAPWRIDYELSLPMTEEQHHADLQTVPIPALTAPAYSDTK